MLFLCLVAVFFATSEAYQSCSWTLYPGQSIDGGSAVPVSSLAECQAVCAQSTGTCQGLDFDPSSNGCWLLGTKDGKRSNPSIQHYDYDCQEINPCAFSPCQNGGVCSPSGQSYQCSCPSGYTGANCETLAVRDVLAGASDRRCFKTNYKGSPTDFASAPNGVNFDFGVATFGYDFPQAGFLISLNFLMKVNQITFGASDNLAYFRVVFTKNWGSAVTTKAIFPNDQNVVLDGIDNVKRVDFYLVPVDYRRNISINDFAFRNCPIIDIGGLACNVLDSLKDIITIGSLGIIRPGGKTGTFSISIAPNLPYFELDLSCIGAGVVSFSQLKFDRISNINQVLVNIWNGAQRVTVIRSDNVATDTFNPAVPIAFGSGVVGNRIRVSFVPASIVNNGLSGSVWFSRFQIYAS